MSGYRTYKETKDSGVEWLGEVPTEWDVAALSTVSTKITNGYVGPTRGLFVKSGVTYLQSLHIKNNQIIFHKPYFVTHEWSLNHRKSILKRGDVLIVQTGDIGQVAAVSNNFSGANCHALIVVSLTKRLDGFFLSQVLNSSYGFGSLKSIQTGALHPHLNCDAVKTIKIPLPPLPEQRQIAAFLDRECEAMDALMAKQERLITLLKEKRQALISHTVTRGLPPEAAAQAGLDPHPKLKDSGIEWLGEVPEGWKAGKLGFYSSILSGYAFPSSGFTLDKSGTRLLRGINIGVSRIRWDESVYWHRKDGDGLGRFELQEGDLVLGMDRPWISEGIRVAKISQEDLPCLLLQRVASIETSPHLLTDYLYRILASEMFSDYFTPDMTGVSVPHISPDQVSNFKIPLPPLPEQHAIVAYLDAACARIDTLVAKAESAIALLKERRTALISAAVTGKIDVREL